MSEANVEYLVRGYEAMNGGDLEAVVADLASDFELIPPGILPDMQVYRGPDGFRRFITTWQESFDDFRVEIEETIDAGDQVIVMAAVCGRVKEIGIEVRTPSFPHIWTFEGDRIVRMEAMQNKALAFAALGLTE